MDGHISTAAEQASLGLPKGPLNYAPGYGTCDRAPFAVRETGWVMQAKNPSLVVGSNGLWNLAHTDNQVYFAKIDHSRCANQGTRGCAGWSKPTGVKVPQTIGPFAVAAAGDIVVFTSASKSVPGGYDLYYMKGTPWQASNSAMSAPQAVGGPAVLGQPVATVDPVTAVVSVYAAASVPGVSWDIQVPLSRWDYDPKTSTWVKLGEVQIDIDGAPMTIDPTVAPAITRGYQSGGLLVNESSAEFVYLLYQQFHGHVQMARLTTRSIPVTLNILGYSVTINIPLPSWDRMPDALLQDLADSLSIPSGTLGLGPSRLGLAFRPEPQPGDAGSGIFVSGRFFMTFTGSAFGNLSAPLTTFTKGNVFWDGVSPRPSERELVFVAYNNFFHAWANIPDGLTLAYFDGNVRAVAQTDIPVTLQEVFDPVTEKRFSPPSTSYFPNADGIFNEDEHDFNDQALIIKNLKASLVQYCH